MQSIPPVPMPVSSPTTPEDNVTEALVGADVTSTPFRSPGSRSSGEPQAGHCLADDPRVPHGLYAQLTAPPDEAVPDETERSALEHFPAILQALGLFGLIGMSVGLMGWQLWQDPELVRSYIVKNDLLRDQRQAVLLSMLMPALLSCGAAVTWLARRGAQQGERLRSAAWRASPLLIAGFVPSLLRWKLWQDRDLVFLTLASVVIWGLRRLTLIAGSQPPLGIRERTLAALDHVRDLVFRPRFRQRVLPALPTLVVWLAALGYTAFFTYHTIENHYRLGTSAYDLALEENIIWNLLHGGPPFKSSPLGGPTSIHFGYHATLFSYVLVPFYALYQHAETMLFIQALLIGLAALPLYWFARPQIGAWPAALLGLAYVLNPAVQGSNLYDFHYPPLGPVFLWLALYALQARRNLLAAVAIILSLSVREDVAAGVAIIGVYTLFWGRRPKAGLIVTLVGMTYFVVIKLVIMPTVLGHGAFAWIFKDLLPSGESSFGAVLKTVIANPAYTWSTLIVERKFIYLLQIFAPLAFLPLLRPMGWVCTLPGVLFTLLATRYDPPISLGFQYASHWVAYLFPALAVALAYEQRAQHPFDLGQRARKRSWLVAVAFGTLVVGYQYGILFQQNIARAAWDPVHFGFTEHDRERLMDLRETIKLMPPLAKVAGSERVLPHMANRPDAYRLRDGLYDAEYVLVDQTQLGSDEKKYVVTALRDNSFGVVSMRSDFLLARRGEPTTRNAQALKRLR
jgi:uncharacterized membrane protein